MDDGLSRRPIDSDSSAELLACRIGTGLAGNMADSGAAVVAHIHSCEHFGVPAGLDLEEWALSAGRLSSELELAEAVVDAGQSQVVAAAG